jgi:hypothetical protein
MRIKKQERIGGGEFKMADFYNKSEREKLSKAGKGYYEVDEGYVKMIEGCVARCTDKSVTIPRILKALNSQFGTKIEWKK